MSNQSQPVKGKFRNARLTSVISISLVLFVLGIIAFMGVFANQLSTFVKENVGFTIVLKDEATGKEVAQLRELIEKSGYARSFQYISKEDALKELTEELGESPAEFLGFNPLQASVEVKLYAQYANNDSIAMIEKAVRKVLPKQVSAFNYRKDIVKLINDNVRKMSLGLTALAVVLLLISFTLINNTVRLSIYSKRFLIHTMKLVGATPGFIRRPFVTENILNGIFASIIAMLCLGGLILKATSEYPGFEQIVNTRMLVVVFAIILALGVIITALASLFATNRYIRMQGDDMYLV